MKKLFATIMIASATLSFTSQTFASSQLSSAKQTKKLSILLGTVDTGADTIQLYGDTVTGIVEYVIILETQWEGFNIVSINNIKIFNGIATGKIYTANENGSQRIIVLSALPVY